MEHRESKSDGSSREGFKQEDDNGEVKRMVVRGNKRNLGKGFVGS